MSGHLRRLRTPIEILYEDERFVVFNKPAGLLVIPSPKGESRTLVSIVNDQQLNGQTHQNPPKLHPCHRLDRDTSGVILFAKGKKNQQLMMSQFKNGKVKKLYTAFVHGKLSKRHGEFRTRTKTLESRTFRKQSRGERALTRFRVVNIKKKYSVVEVEPVTGKTNQIRIQFADVGHPLVGERKYAFARDFELKFKRVALHAAKLAWSDPVDQKSHSAVAKLPDDMKNFRG